MATTKKKPSKKRYLTQSERKQIRQKMQSLATLLFRLLADDKIDSQTRGVIKKMHKCVIDAVAYSNQLNFLE